MIYKIKNLSLSSWLMMAQDRLNALDGEFFLSLFFFFSNCSLMSNLIWHSGRLAAKLLFGSVGIYKENLFFFLGNIGK